MANEGNCGVGRLASVLSWRMRQELESPLVLDFGETLGDGSLVTNTFPAPVPKGDYSLLGGLGPLSPGDRVLVAWVFSEAIILGTVESS